MAFDHKKVVGFFVGVPLLYAGAFKLILIGSAPSKATEAAGVIVGTARIRTPSAVEGAVEGSVAMPRVEDSEACTAAAVVEVGTPMVAVMITLAAATSMVTSDVSTPAAIATLCCKLEVSS